MKPMDIFIPGWTPEAVTGGTPEVHHGKTGRQIGRMIHISKVQRSRKDEKEVEASRGSGGLRIHEEAGEDGNRFRKGNRDVCTIRN